MLLPLRNVLFTHDDILMLVRLIYHLTQLCCLIINRQGVVIIIYRRQIIQIMLYPEESLKIAILSIPITTMNDSHWIGNGQCFGLPIWNRKCSTWILKVLFYIH